MRSNREAPALLQQEREPKAQRIEAIPDSTGVTEPNTAEGRRALKQARRTIGAALAQGRPPADLVAAACLVIEAGRSGE